MQPTARIESETGDNKINIHNFKENLTCVCDKISPKCEKIIYGDVIISSGGWKKFSKIG